MRYENSFIGIDLSLFARLSVLLTYIFIIVNALSRNRVEFIILYSFIVGRRLVNSYRCVFFVFDIKKVDAIPNRSYDFNRIINNVQQKVQIDLSKFPQSSNTPKLRWAFYYKSNMKFKIFNSDIRNQSMNHHTILSPFIYEK